MTTGYLLPPALRIHPLPGDGYCTKPTSCNTIGTKGRPFPTVRYSRLKLEHRCQNTLVPSWHCALRQFSSLRRPNSLTSHHRRGDVGVLTLVYSTATRPYVIPAPALAAVGTLR